MLQLSTTFLHAINIFRIELLKAEPHCSHIVEIFDVRQSNLVPCIHGSEDTYAFKTVLILPDIYGRNSAASTQNLVYATSKFQSPCAFIFIDLTPFYARYSELVPEDTQPWLPPTALGSPQREVHFFLIDSCDQGVLATQVRQLAKKIYRPFFLLFCSDVLKVFNVAANGESTKELGSVGCSSTCAYLGSLRGRVDLEGSGFMAVTCASCSRALAVHAETRKWMVALIGSIAEFSYKVLNFRNF